MKNMLTDSAQYEFQLDNQFFMDLDAPEVQKGHVNVALNVRKTSGIYQLDFHLEGMAIVTCDRCLDEMEQPIEADERLKVKLGSEFSEIDDIVVVPEEDGYINVAWFIYEFIALSIPMKQLAFLLSITKHTAKKFHGSSCFANSSTQILENFKSFSKKALMF